MTEYIVRMWIEGRGHTLESPSLAYCLADDELSGSLLIGGESLWAEHRLGFESISGKRIDAAVGKMVGGLKYLLEHERGGKIREFRAEYVPAFEDPAAGWDELRADLDLSRPTYGRLGELIESAAEAPGIEDLRYFLVPRRDTQEDIGERQIHKVWDAYLLERRGLTTREFDGIIEYFSDRRLPISEIKPWSTL
ncbi:hypothetical protein HY495_02905 [Candidatus Woesearchaeota archaeon]|nr:hypothetical protein [Candidatus Woesearchaeota archaeon]